MLSYRKGKVVEIEDEDEQVSWLIIDLDGKIAKAVNYNGLTGKAKIGDIIIVNTTAVELSLGTGGTHFVIFNYSNETKDFHGSGHIMKLRYTPIQIKCLAAEEENSPYHKVFNTFKSLDNHIFIVGSLHSMLAPIVAMLKYLNENIKINYIMTDGGSLPIFFSNTVRILKEKKLIENTITIGHAFGGDLECTNIYTGLIAAKEILKGDVTIITMGPGIVGTDTKYGFSGIEQGYIIDAINTLGGQPIIVPRISFQDKRDRHKGISHHTRTILSEISKTSGKVIIPKLDRCKLNIINGQINNLNLYKKYKIIYEEGDKISDAMNKYGLYIKTMGRGYNEDKEYFLTLGAVGNYVYKMLG
ncbi:DUF3866 family protein [Keratinibaculum paraultunense]|nr:DUF3866 family protein [Keratinibaculum paraultunense]